MFDKIVFSLNPRVGDPANFGGIEFLPLLLIKLDKERNYRKHRNEVDERVTDVALVLEKRISFGVYVLFMNKNKKCAT